MSQDHYRALGLPLPHKTSFHITAAEVKKAYRRALLNHHPDKSRSRQPTRSGTSEYTVDQITTAYEVLSNSLRHSKYGQTRTINETQLDSVLEPRLPGLEVVDLDDLNIEELAGMTIWSRSCRCGNPKGFCISERDLEKVANQCEIVSGCQGCSLWLKVMFEIANDD